MSKKHLENLGNVDGTFTVRLQEIRIGSEQTQTRKRIKKKKSQPELEHTGSYRFYTQ